MGEVAPVAVIPPGLDVTVYPVTTLPPLLVGATNATLAEAFPAVATTAVGAPGTTVVTQGTPGQFSSAAFFQRTFNSSMRISLYIPGFIFESSIIGAWALSDTCVRKKVKKNVTQIKGFVFFILKRFSDLLVPNISLKHIHIEEKQI
jgi:hypothetical protein